MEIFTVSFFGHRQVEDFALVEERAERLVGELITGKPYLEFLVGRNGEFDQMIASCLLRAKRKWRDDNNFLVLVLPYPTAEYRGNVSSFESYYDEIEICEQAAGVHFKSAIQTRNRYMVDRSDLVVCYVKRPCGGAYQTVCYAEQEHKAIINLAEGSGARAALPHGEAQLAEKN